MNIHYFSVKTTAPNISKLGRNIYFYLWAKNPAIKLKKLRAGEEWKTTKWNGSLEKWKPTKYRKLTYGS